MNRFYVACDLGPETGRVSLGTLDHNKLNVSEVRRFQNVPIEEKGSLQWNIPQLYQETMDGLRSIGEYDEPVDSISCSSWSGDYLLFESDGSLITPAYHSEPQTEEGIKKVASKVPPETVYQETGVQLTPANTLSQLAMEKSRRLSRARHLLPVADGFNFLLAGVARVETSLASGTQLFNPVTRAWSERLFDALYLPQRLFPPIVPAGTELAALRPEIAKETRLEDARVVASCSNALAAALAGLPVAPGEKWAYLQTGAHAVMGTQLAAPLINSASLQAQFTNELGYGGVVHFHKQVVGLWMLDECRRSWAAKERSLDGDLLNHLAGAVTPFECLVNVADPRFLQPGDMPEKIQSFCRDTSQPVPRKPGAIFRCVLESLALHYRKALHELQRVTGTAIDSLYILDGAANTLLTHFTANALGIPVVIATGDAAPIGNVIVQALALGHIKSLDEAREIVRSSVHMERIVPHSVAWNAAYDRFSQMFPA